MRLLTAALDDAVEEVYELHGLDFRPRYFPFFRMLMERESASVGEFVSALGFTQPATTQTLHVMREAGLVEPVQTGDRRMRRYRLTQQAKEMVPRLEEIWAAVAAAADRLDKALPAPLGSTVDAALEHLSSRPFREIIEREMAE
ncbi:MAG TPA: helix-turn-helix domain-containing protein [Alteraurantiacibacter sp.]